MSLRIKFLALLVFIPSLCLGIFLYFAITTFVNDKKLTLLENQFHLLNSTNLFLLKSQESEDLKNAISNLKMQEGFENLLIVTPSGKLWPNHNESLEAIYGNEIFQKLLAQTSSEGSFEAKAKEGNQLLLSFLKIELGQSEPLILIISTPSSMADRASIVFLFRAIAAFAALISIAVLISIMFSNRLTMGIQSLSKAMIDFGSGHFDTELPKLRSDDEVASMTRQFQIMRTQIKNLISEKEEKTRIETEMNLAGILQKSFFPESLTHFLGVEFAGFFQPASHAGGDWWHYFQKDRHFVFLIGDVTGHGLNSAMLTGAARAAMSIISATYISPADTLERLNQVICETAGGKLMMTCAVGALNTETGEFQIANASHEVPFSIPAIDMNLTKSDLTYFISNPGPRLGEVNGIKFSTSTFQIRDGESLIFFSDGLLDTQNPEGKAFGERQLVKTVIKDHHSKMSAQELMEKIRRQVLQFKSSSELVDDLSFFVVKWNKQRKVIQDV